jgi:uncharacterized protein YybS (DUF2232 family)
MIAKDLLGCMGWVALVLFASVAIPIVGPFVSLITPVPFLFYASKLGFHRGLKLAIAVVFVISLVSAFFGQPQVILFCLEFSALGLALSEMLRRAYSLGYTLFMGTVCMLIIGMASLLVIAIYKDMGPFELVRAYLKSNLNDALQMYKQMGMQQEKTVQIQNYGKAVIETISRIYPALLVVGSAFVVWVNVFLGRRILRMAHLEYPSFSEADRWQAPEMLIWGLIAAGFSLFFPLDVIRLLAINGFIILMTVYLFQGVSILLFFLNKYHVSPWIRAMIYFLLIFQQIFLLVVAIGGIFDQWVDFRKIRRKPGA